MPEGPYDFVHVSFLIPFACRCFGQQSKKWLLQLPSTGLMRAGPSFHRQPGALAEVDGSLDPFMFSIYWHTLAYIMSYTLYEEICDFFDSPQTKAMKKTEVRDILEGSLSGERRQASLGFG